jgi:signal transduction histidine kinase
MTRDELQEQIAKKEETIRLLQEELAETNRGLIALTLELEQRVDARTAELQKLNAELEARVRQRTAELQQANENLQTFAHSAAHDLRAPLRTLRSMANVAIEDYAPKLEAEGQLVMKRIDDAAGHMQEILDDLLEYSQVAQGEIRLRPVNLDSAVTEALELLNSDIRAKNARVTVAGALPSVMAHPATLVLLINNFLTNALKFMPPDREPIVHIRAETPALEPNSEPAAANGPSHSGPLPRNGLVRLCVEDNGIGIARSDLGKIFGVFQRLHSRHEYPGTGLGLALVKKAAERMGGQIGVESEPGKGSTFWLELPAA